MGWTIKAGIPPQWETHHDSQEPRWLVAWPPNELEFVLDSKHENLLKAAMFLVNLSPDIQVRVKVKAPARAAEMVAASPSTCLLLPRQSKKITFFARDYDESCCKIKLEAERLMMDATSNLKEQHNYWVYEVNLRFPFPKKVSFKSACDELEKQPSGVPDQNNSFKGPEHDTVDENVQEKLIQELKSIISGNAVCSQSAPLEKVSTPVSGRLIELHSDGPGCSSQSSFSSRETSPVFVQTVSDRSYLPQGSQSQPLKMNNVTRIPHCLSAPVQDEYFFPEDFNSSSNFPEPMDNQHSWNSFASTNFIYQRSGSLNASVEKTGSLKSAPSSSDWAHQMVFGSPSPIQSLFTAPKTLFQNEATHGVLFQNATEFGSNLEAISKDFYSQGQILKEAEHSFHSTSLGVQDQNLPKVESFSGSTSTETSFKSLPDSGEAHKYTILGSSLLCNSGRSQQLGFKVEEHPEYVPCEAQCVDEDVASAPKPSGSFRGSHLISGTWSNMFSNSSADQYLPQQHASSTHFRPHDESMSPQDSQEDAAMGNKFKELPPLQTFKSSVGIIKIGLMDSKNSIPKEVPAQTISERPSQDVSSYIPLGYGQGFVSFPLSSQPSLTQASSLKCSEIIHPKTPVPSSTDSKVPVKKTPKKLTTINQMAKMYLRKHGVSGPLRQDKGDCKMEPVAERTKFSCSVNPFLKTLTGGVSILAKSLIGLCFAGVLICVLEELMESLH